MFPELQWIVIPLLLFAVAAMLLWGLRRQPRSELEMEVEEILSDDPPPEPPGGTQPEPVHLSSELMQHRRLLVRLLGVDTPDLVVAVWIDPQDPRVRIASHRQVFIPAGAGTRKIGERLEQEIFDGADAEGIPEGSRLAGACSFVSRQADLPDLVVYSYFNRTEMEHTLFRADADGKLSLLPEEPPGRLHFGADPAREEWKQLRAGLELLRRRDTGAWEQVRDNAAWRLERDFQSGRDHAWMAGALRMTGGEKPLAEKHLSLALEFSPACLLARGERAHLRGEAALQDFGNWLHEVLRDESDDPVIAGYLLCGALDTLWREDLARPLAESLLSTYPRHPAIGQLRRFKGSATRGRGAQM